jgi:hypothetical protein
MLMTSTPISCWHRIALEALPDEIAPLLAEDVVFESPGRSQAPVGQGGWLEFLPPRSGGRSREGGGLRGDSL